MRTDELINTLVADHAARPRAKPVGSSLTMAIITGLGISAARFSLTLSVRPDLPAALATWRFDLKLGDALVLALAATWVALRLSRPTTTTVSGMKALLVPALLLLGAVVYELVTVPSSDWPSRAMGVSASMCFMSIISLSLVPLMGVIYALRQGAPSSPAVAGAVGGLLAGAVGATVFAIHCTNDSPLFVAIWYALAIGLVATVGLLAGQYVLALVAH
jgi:hypothetical protein